MQNGAAVMENSMAVPQKIKKELPYDPAILLLGIYPKEVKSGSQRDISIPMFTAALFTKVKIWKQPKCASMHECIKKCGIYIQWNIIQP